MKSKHNIYFIEIVCGLNEKIHVKCLEQWWLLILYTVKNRDGVDVAQWLRPYYYSRNPEFSSKHACLAAHNSL